MMFIDRFQDGNKGNNDFGEGEFQADSPSHFNGGDLQGIIDRLDYIQGLGATAIWISPPVRNQWWSTPYEAAGWHGYWAENFRKLDPHFGSLEDYKRLSHELHCRGMYLIQDIVINHTANYYAYDGRYNPEDPTENFYLLEEGNTGKIAPTQPPFNMIDPRVPEHREANIYHWTPMLTDYEDPHQMNYYAFGYLADINTENPAVLEAFKDTYAYWINEVGVDGYRIDTVQYVNHPFWHHFLHDADGIYATAARTGREHFLTFGETLVPSKPFEPDGEQRIAGYFGTEEQPALNSMLGFPLYFTLRQVLSESQPAAQLAYRLEQHMAQYPDPYVIPTFIDNHDTARFLSTGGQDAFEQALALIFTIPGLPIIYQGTEQMLPETRQSMFEGGWLAKPNTFDPQSDAYQLIRNLAALRAGNAVFMRGDLEVLTGETTGPGLLVYKRTLGDDSALILMNTADHAILVHALDAGLAPGQVSKRILFGGDDVIADGTGHLNLTLPTRAVWVLQPGDGVVAVEPAPKSSVQFEQRPGDAILTSDFELAGTIDQPGVELQLIINGNLDNARTFTADNSGHWQITLPVRDLGETRSAVQIYAPATNSLSERIEYRTRVSEPEIEVSVVDDPDDAYGPTGSYIPPQHSESGRQREMESASIRAAGRNLELVLTMAEVTDVWVPNNGYDNLAVTVFVSFPGSQGARALPFINAQMPDGLTWDLAHVGSGWMSYAYSAEGAGPHEQGRKLGVAPRVSADKASRTIRMFYEGAKLGVDDWSGATLYITTWDFTGEGSYLELRPEPAEWFFGGASGDSPKIMDDLLIKIGD